MRPTAAGTRRASRARGSCLVVIHAYAGRRRGTGNHVLVLPDRHRRHAAGETGRPRSSGRRVAGDQRVRRLLQWQLPLGATSAAIWLTSTRTSTSSVRHHARTVRQDRYHGAPPRGAQPEGGLSRADDDGRLPPRAPDFDAVLPVRLRRAVRRFDGGHRVAPSTGPRPAPPRGGLQGGRHGASRSAIVGSVRRHHDQMATRDAAAQMWGADRSAPSDVQMAQLFDGFSVPGAGLDRVVGILQARRGRVVHRGRCDIDLGGTLPVNTGGRPTFRWPPARLRLRRRSGAPTAR